MESNFTNDEFEDFLKRSADGMRMRPSNKVWEGIAGRLQKRRRRVAYATSAFVLLSSLLGYFFIDNTKNLSNHIATLPAEVKEANNQPSSHTLSTTSVTEAKVIDINRNALTKATNPSIQNSYGIGQRTVLSKNDKMSQFNEDTTTSSNEFTPTIIDSDAVPTEQQTATENIETSVSAKLLSIESVSNLFRAGRKKAKLNFQVFFTPTVSYRKLTENKSYLRSIPPQNLVNSPAIEEDVNDAVTHKPDMGLEVGMAAKYPITKNIKLRGGLQFNVNRYDIKAFKHTPEVATIALNMGPNNGVDFIGAVTDYRNFNGYRSDWLQNFYFQVSVPMGAELKLYSNKNTHFGIAGTIQPTYLLGERAYLLSSDYKNYSKVPWLTRHWNVNTAIETFVSYSTGRMQWQVGPQVRYQLLSSFVTKYPLKENLFDFGFKVGVSINKNTLESTK